MLVNFMSLLSSAEFSFEKIVLKMSFSNKSRALNCIDSDKCPTVLSLIWVKDVDKVYQRMSFRRQIFDVVGK